MQEDTTRQIFLQNFNRLLRQTGKTQTDLAAYLGVKSPTVSGWKSGEIMPRIDKMRDMAEFFGVTEDDLLKPPKRKLPEVPKGAKNITDIILELFADRPDVQKLLANGVYEREGGSLVNKKLEDISAEAKAAIRINILMMLKSEGLI